MEDKKWSDYNNLTTCRQNYSYFTTSDFMIASYSILSFVNIPLDVFTFFVIIRKTPASMKKMRPALLFAQFCNTNLDICTTLLACPMAFFPSAAALTLGVLTKLGVPFKWQGYWGQVSIMMNGVAFVMLYENRHSQVTTIKFKIKSEIVRRLFCLVLIVFAFLSILPFYLEDTNQLELRKFVLARVPCPTIEFFDPATYVLLKGGEEAPFYSITLMAGYVVFQSFFFAIHILLHTVLIPNVNVSPAIKKLQLKFLGAVTLQFTIPIIAHVAPTLYTLYSDKYNYYNQTLNNFTVLGFASHGLFATSVTLMIYWAFRRPQTTPEPRNVENDIMNTI